MNAYSMIAVYLIAIFMLIAPLWVLSVVKRPHVKLTVITVFLVVFLTVLSFATRAQPFEILATTAA
jgi:hypothetical protein